MWIDINTYKEEFISDDEWTLEEIQSMLEKKSGKFYAITVLDVENTSEHPLKHRRKNHITYRYKAVIK